MPPDTENDIDSIQASVIDGLNTELVILRAQNEALTKALAAEKCRRLADRYARAASAGPYREVTELLVAAYNILNVKSVKESSAWRANGIGELIKKIEGAGVIRNERQR